MLGDRKRPPRRCCASTTSSRSPTRQWPAAAELEPLRDIIVRQGYKLDSAARSSSMVRAAIGCACGVRRCPGRGRRRRSRARRSANRGVRLFPAAYAAGTRRPRGPGWTGCATGGSALLLSECAARLGSDDEFVARTRRSCGLSRQLVVGGSAQQPRDATTSSKTTTRWRRKPSTSCSRSSRTARAPSAPHGSRGGGRTRTASTPRRYESSKAQRRHFRARITGHRSSIGRPARTASSEPAPRLNRGFGSSVTDYGNSYYGRLAAAAPLGARAGGATSDAVPGDAPVAGCPARGTRQRHGDPFAAHGRPL